LAELAQQIALAEQEAFEATKQAVAKRKALVALEAVKQAKRKEQEADKQRELEQQEAAKQSFAEFEEQKKT